MKAVNFDTSENIKLRKDALYGQSVFKIMELLTPKSEELKEKFIDELDAKEDAKSRIEYLHKNFCSNRDVATGNYDCPYATTVINTICCTGHECNYRGIYEKPVVNNTAPFEPIVINEEDLPF